MAGRPDTRAGVDVPAEPPVARHGDVGCPVDAVVVDGGIVAQSCGSEDLFFLGPKQGFLVRQREIAESLDSSWRLLRKRRLASRVKKPLFASGDSGFSRCEC